MECERNKGITDTCSDFGLRTWRDGLSLTEIGRTVDRAGENEDSSLGVVKWSCEEVEQLGVREV